MVPPNHEGVRKYNPTMSPEMEGNENYLQKGINRYHAKFTFESFQF
jgi:hypothetical protein